MMQKMRMQLVSTTSCELSVSVKFLQKLYESARMRLRRMNVVVDILENNVRVYVSAATEWTGQTSELLRSVRTQLTNNL